jgi:Acetyltransferase (GNAT) domain/Acetyltransferase (GNAT) family
MLLAPPTLYEGMRMHDCSIRTMCRGEIDLAIELAAREGWNPGLHDAQCFAETDPDGFLISEVDGRLAGCLSAVSYSARFGFIGLYIVVPERRGEGIGWRLWTQGMQRLAGRLVGLDGVPAQQHNYRKSGFVLAWRNVRYAGTAQHAWSSADAGVAGVVPLAEINFAALCADDRRVFPAPRERFLRAWISVPDAVGLACVEGTRLCGWGVIRRCREGHKIAPLVADTKDIANLLYAALCERVPEGDAVYLDVPLPNADGVTLAENNGMRGVFETARMYTGAAPPCELQRVFGITSFELG